MADLLAQLSQALVDRYTVQRQLGRGGMATVFLAQDLRHERPVALKVLHPELSASLGPERFQREIKLAARLQHPHILTVLDSGEAASHLWFTMPYVEGESLRDRLDSQKQLAVDEAVRLGRECALALDYAHRHGVIHRDIKPENILLIDGQAMVADFGIARALTGGESLTETGITVGTPAYMSPEQATGERELDARTDIYSLGCVVYEMLVGEPPFTGAIPQTIIARRFTETPRSIRAVRGGVPSGVEHAAMKALERVPADRFATAAEFAKALEAGGRPERPSSGQQAPPSPSLVRAAAPRGKAAPLQRPALLLLFGFALGLGVLFAWRRAQVNNVADKGPKRLAVLPFENLGDSADSYFADGVTDAVRGKLTSIPGLQVTARGSSSSYRHSDKSQRQIAQELGVQYLLTGTVRWEKQKDGTSKVQVSPELIDAATSASKWQQPFDAALTDVFQVQADIAGRVAQALNVALGSTEREQLAERPTQNIAAYEAFLQGEAASDALGSVDVPSIRRALGLYQQAVALDSGFALAWYRIARCNVLIYRNSTPTPETAAAALEAAKRALALGPALPQSFHAMGSYYSIILGDFERAIQEYEQGLRLDPHNAELLTALGQIEQNLGRWESAIQHLQEAQKVDPRAVDTQRRLSRAFLWTRRYADALAAADRGLALSPTNTEILETKAMAHLAQGDLSGARMVIQSAPAEMTPIRRVADFANYWDLYWALDEADQQLVLRLRASEFDDNVATWANIRAQLYHLRGDQLRARAYADTARAEYVKQIASTPKDPQLHVLLGISLAILGRGDEAIREAKNGIEFGSDDKFVGMYYRLLLARIYTMSGHADEAITTLEPLIEEPFYLSKDWLKIDPNFDPLRSNPRFQKLVAGTV